MRITSLLHLHIFYFVMTSFIEVSAQDINIKIDSCYNYSYDPSLIFITLNLKNEGDQNILINEKYFQYLHINMTLNDVDTLVGAGNIIVHNQKIKLNPVIPVTDKFITQSTVNFDSLSMDEQNDLEHTFVSNKHLLRKNLPDSDTLKLTEDIGISLGNTFYVIPGNTTISINCLLYIIDLWGYRIIDVNDTLIKNTKIKLFVKFRYRKDNSEMLYEKWQPVYNATKLKKFVFVK